MSVFGLQSGIRSEGSIRRRHSLLFFFASERLLTKREKIVEGWVGVNWKEQIDGWMMRKTNRLPYCGMPRGEGVFLWDNSYVVRLRSELVR